MAFHEVSVRLPGNLIAAFGILHAATCLESLWAIRRMIADYADQSCPSHPTPPLCLLLFDILAAMNGQSARPTPVCMPDQ